jgi:hypothetical protein
MTTTLEYYPKDEATAYLRIGEVASHKVSYERELILSIGTVATLLNTLGYTKYQYLTEPNGKRIITAISLTPTHLYMKSPTKYGLYEQQKYVFNYLRSCGFKITSDIVSADGKSYRLDKEFSAVLNDNYN